MKTHGMNWELNMELKFNIKKNNHLVT